jgi:hypothetical protein
MEVSCQLHASVALPPVPIGYKTVPAAELVWMLRRTETFLPLIGVEPQFLFSPARSRVAVPTEISIAMQSESVP